MDVYEKINLRNTKKLIKFVSTAVEKGEYDIIEKDGCFYIEILFGFKEEAKWMFFLLQLMI